MTNLNLTHRTTGIHISYKLEDIESFKVGKAKDWYTKEDCEGNGIKYNDTVLRIAFKDNTSSSFGDVWMYSFS